MTQKNKATQHKSSAALSQAAPGSKKQAQTASGQDNNQSASAQAQSEGQAVQAVKKGLLALLVSIILLTVAALAYGYSLIQPTNPNQPTRRRVVIVKGESITTIAHKLHQQQLIRHPLAFRLMAQYQGLDQKLQAGSFKLAPAMTLTEIIQTLTEGTDDIWITLAEGLRREEIAQSLANYDLEFYQQEQFLAQTVGLEGKLFPDTYLVPKQIETQAIVNLLTSTFDNKLVEEELAVQIEQSEHSLNQILTMASLLEREARGLSQMKQVADVLWRRLDKGMPLQVDATLQYAKGYSEQTRSWWAPPQSQDKKLESPFNTYLNPGLPPRPICNPGLDAITAALNPRANQYLYYLHDHQGRIHFARTLNEHNANIDQYLR